MTARRGSTPLNSRLTWRRCGFVITPPQITCYQFPDDVTDGQAAFLEKFTDPNKTWLRAYGFTMVNLVDDMVAAAKNGVAYHVFVDLSEEETPTEKPLVSTLSQGFKGTKSDLTIGTSQAGRKYIMHQKGFTTAADDCWEGSVNFSTSGWLQVNSAMQFNDATWQQHFVQSFLVDQAYAWASESQYQLGPQPPSVPAGVSPQEPPRVST